MARVALDVVTPPEAPGEHRGDRLALLSEMLRRGPQAARDGMSDDLVRRWRTLLGVDLLDRRLAWSDAFCLTDQGGGAWRSLLETALSEAETPVAGHGLDPQAPLPFEAALLPFVRVARRDLDEAAGPALRLFSPLALSVLERGLLTLLSHLALPALSSEFSLRRALAGRLPWLERPGADDDYRAFIAMLGSGGLRCVLEDYPGLARLLATTAQDWARAQARLMRRLDRDWPDLRVAMDLADSDCSVEAIEADRSDPHDGGQQVAILILTSGRSVVYKPRPVDMEEGLGVLLGWANHVGFPWPLRTVTVLSRRDYGWMEHISAAPCDDEAAVRRFYARSGGLFCLWWLLQGTDLHHENLIASGEQPVIVDAETLLHPRPFDRISDSLGAGTRYGKTPDDDFARALQESGFLPSGQAVDLSAWGTVGGVVTPFRVAACRAVNSDAMVVGQDTFHVAPRPNLPHVAGQPALAMTHADAIVEGFRAMYGLVRWDRDGFLSTLDRFAGRRGRFIARATNVYGLLLNASLQPEWLREGAARGVCYERLRRTAVQERVRPDCWPWLDAELEALERLDVPRFTNVCDQSTVYWSAPLTEVRARVAKVSDETLDQYAEALRRALVDLGERAGVPTSQPEGEQV